MSLSPPHLGDDRATVPVQLNSSVEDSVEHHLNQAQDAVNAAQKSPITLDELESIKAIAEEQIRRSDEALARLSQRAEKLKESRASLLQKAEMNIMEMRAPHPQPPQRASPPIVQPSPFRSAPLSSIISPPGPTSPTKAASYLSATPATNKDRSPRNSLLDTSVPTSSRDAELAEFGALGERLSQTFAKMELLGQETSKPRGVPGKQVSPDISLNEDISAIRKEREELQKRYRHVVETQLAGSSAPNSARDSTSTSSFQPSQMTPIMPVTSAHQTPQSRWNVAVDPTLSASTQYSALVRPVFAKGTQHSSASAEANLPQYRPISSASAATWAQMNRSANHAADMPSKATQPSPLQPPSPQTQEQFRQATAMLKESFTEAKVDRNTLAVVRKSKALPGGDSVTLVGLHVPVELGLRVKPVDPSLDYANGGPGIVTRIHGDGNACFVKWDAREEECGWYKCGVRGYYALKLIPREEEGPMLPDNVVQTGGNSKADVEERRTQYDEENMFAADKVLLDIGDFLGAW